jgi:hypothetical protein
VSATDEFNLNRSLSGGASIARPCAAGEEIDQIVRDTRTSWAEKIGQIMQ